MATNRQIVLDNRPDGEATTSNFKLVTSETPALADRKSTRLNSSHLKLSRMPSSA